MPFTVIIGPPERIRTRSPGWNEAPVWPDIAAGAESEKAGTDKGMLSAIPSANVAAIETRFVKIDIVELHL
jgi:hypothetical protein